MLINLSVLLLHLFLINCTEKIEEARFNPKTNVLQLKTNNFDNITRLGKFI